MRARVEGPVTGRRGQKKEQNRPDEVRAVTAEDWLPEEPLYKSVAVDDPDSLEPEGACSLPLVAGRGEWQEDWPQWGGGGGGQGGGRQQGGQEVEWAVGVLALAHAAPSLLPAGSLLSHGRKTGGWGGHTRQGQRAEWGKVHINRRIICVDVWNL